MTLDDLLVSYKQVSAPIFNKNDVKINDGRYRRMLEYVQKKSSNDTQQEQPPFEFSWDMSHIIPKIKQSTKSPSTQNPNTILPTPNTILQTSSKFIPGSIADNARYAYNYFINNGLSREIASGIIGNLWHEGLHNPSSYNSDSRGTVSLGIAQFNSKGELPMLKEFARQRGLKVEDMDTQLLYLTDVVKNRLWSHFSNITTPEEASYNFGKYFEKFAGKNGRGYLNYDDDEHVKRRSTALKIYNDYGKSNS